MATARDRAVLQSIFHPDSPFGELSGQEEEEEEEEEGQAEGRAAFSPEGCWGGGGPPWPQQTRAFGGGQAWRAGESKGGGREEEGEGEGEALPWGARAPPPTSRSASSFLGALLRPRGAGRRAPLPPGRPPPVLGGRGRELGGGGREEWGWGRCSLRVSLSLWAGVPPRPGRPGRQDSAGSPVPLGVLLATEDAPDPRLLEEATRLEIEGVRAAEAGDLDGALESFGRAIQLLPERASAYNNRAQAFRLKGDVASALEDLETVLELSRGAGPVARQGFVQRGLIRRLEGREEEARRDFGEAARLGSSFARQQLVRMNPYAALCNQMLSEVMKQLRGRETPREEAGGRD